jgi:hypothetical protein
LQLVSTDAFSGVGRRFDDFGFAGYFLCPGKGFGCLVGKMFGVACLPIWFGNK